MTDPRPVHKCAVRGCPMRGRWPEGECCPDHYDPLADIDFGLPAADLDDEAQT